MGGDPRPTGEAAMKLRCAVIDDFQSVATTVVDWSPVTADVEVVSFTEHLATEDEAAAALADFDIVVTLRERVPFPADLFARLPRLRLLVASGMRNSVIDFDAAKRHGVTVCGTASSSTPPVELTWALLLGLARGIVPEAEALRTDGPWQSTLGADLHGRTLGLLGLGKIGGRVAQVGRAFGMEVLAWSQNLTEERTGEVGATLAASKEDLLASSDFVSVHLALGDRTRGLIGAAELALMRPTAYLVNTSRAAIVNRTPCSPPCVPGPWPGPRPTCSTSSRYPQATRCARPRACSPPRTWVMCRAPTTRPTTARPWRTSGPSSTGSRSAAWADGGRLHRRLRSVAQRRRDPAVLRQ